MSKHGPDYNLGIYDKDGKYNQKRVDELVRNNKKMYTNLDNEIEKYDGTTIIDTVMTYGIAITLAFAFVFAIIFALMIADMILGAETVTNSLASLWK